MFIHCAIIFEQTKCSGNLHGTQVRETGLSKPKTYLLFVKGAYVLQVTIPWGGEQTLGLVRSRVLLRLWDAAHQVLIYFNTFLR